MHFVQIFIVTVPLVISYIYQFMVHLRSNLKKSTLFPVLKVFITKAIVCRQPVLFLELLIGLYLCKNENHVFKIIFFGGLKDLTNLNISCTFYVSTMKSCLSSNLKKIWTKKCIDMSHVS